MIDTWYERTMTVNLILEVTRVLTIIVATILVTRRYRQSRMDPLRFLAAGFWCLSLAIVVEVVNVGLTYVHSLTFATSPSVNGMELSPLVNVIGVLQSWLNFSSSLLPAGGILLLAYGALRMTDARHVGPVHSGSDLVPEISELGRAMGPKLRQLRRWILEDPSVDQQ
jgi:hypothetical protein